MRSLPRNHLINVAKNAKGTMSAPATARALGLQHTTHAISRCQGLSQCLPISRSKVDEATAEQVAHNMLRRPHPTLLTPLWQLVLALGSPCDKGTAPPKQPSLQAPHSTMLRYALWKASPKAQVNSAGLNALSSSSSPPRSAALSEYERSTLTPQCLSYNLWYFRRNALL